MRCALLSTPSVNIGLKTAGIAAPASIPKNTGGSIISKPVSPVTPKFAAATFTSLINAPSSAITVNPAA